LNLSDSRLLVIEPSLRENFFPLTYTKPGAGLLFGTRTLLESIESSLGANVSDIYVPQYLKDYTKEILPNLRVNEQISTLCFFVNSFVSHRPEVWKFIQDALNEQRADFSYFDPDGNPVFGFLSEADPDILQVSEKAGSKSRKGHKIQRKGLPEHIGKIALIRHPWELVRDNPAEIEQDYSSRKFSSRSDFSKSISSDIEIRGSKFAISKSADVERFVTLDSRRGPIIIDEGAVVQSFSHIEGPCYVGKRVSIKSARLREGTAVGAGSKVAGEVECSIISDYGNKSHDGYLGHSIVGSWVNLGALTTCSDLKNTYGKIKVKLGRKSVDTGEVKLGVFLGDMSKTSIGTLLTSGKKVGTASQVFGLVSDDVASFTMYGKSLGAKTTEVILESALLTQRRMMERRNLVMTETMVSLIRSVYKMTKWERAFQRVSKARFKLP